MEEATVGCIPAGQRSKRRDDRTGQVGVAIRDIVCKVAKAAGGGTRHLQRGDGGVTTMLFGRKLAVIAVGSQTVMRQMDDERKACGRYYTLVVDAVTHKANAEGKRRRDGASFPQFSSR